MANIKFSQFTQKTTLGTVDFLVGYTGADNVQIDPADLLSDYSQGTGAAGQVTFFSATSTVTGDNDFYWDNTNKRLGIGTTSPTRNLVVSGVGSSASTYIKILGDTSQEAILELHADNDAPGDRWRIAASNSSKLQIRSNGSNVLSVTSSENVGIGTASPSAKLHVDGTLIATGVSQLGSGGSNVYLTSSSAGSVGIGTSSPAYKLDVTGDSSSGVIAVRNLANGRDTFRSENASGVRTVNIGNDANGHGLVLVRGTGGTVTNYITGNGNSYFNAGNVGIGDSGPTAKLVVNNTSTKMLELKRSGNIKFRALADSNDAQLDMFNSSITKSISLHTNSVSYFNGGNVGIGTTNPTEKLQVNSGDILINNSTISSLKSGGSLYIDLNTFGSYSGRNFRISDNGTSLVNVKQTGEVGIGTTSPGVPLDVVGLIRTTTSFVGNACIVNSLTSATSGGSIFFKNNSGVNLAALTDSGNLGIGTTSPETLAHIKVNGGSAQLTLEREGGGAGKVVLAGAAEGFIVYDDAFATKMYVGTSGTYNGNVGIGTISPSKKLEVVSNTTYDGIQISGSSIPTLGIIDTTNNAKFVAYVRDSDATIGMETNHPLTINTNNIERMRIDNTGDILFGTTETPNGTSVYGSAFLSTSNERMALVQASNTTSLATMQTYYNPNGAVGSIKTTGSATQFNTSSDYRLKKDLKDFNGLDKISKIPVYDFKWKVDDSSSYGVMAHELQEVLPDAVSGEKDGEEMQGVDYSKIVPLLIKSIQELEAKVKELESK